MKHLLCLFFALLGCVPAVAQHRVLAVGNNKLIVVGRDGGVEWEMAWPGGTHDLHVLPNGHYLAVRDAKVVVEIDPATKGEVWTYDAGTSNGNAGKPVELHAVQPLANDTFMVAESGPGRIIEIDRAGKLLKEFKLRVEHPNPHRDTRLARKLENGHYLVAHEGDGAIREYDADGAVVWEYAIPLFDKPRADGHGPEAFGNQAFSAIRLKNGNTLIATGNGHSLLEVTPEKEIAWKLQQGDLPKIAFAWLTTTSILANGNIIFGNCHAGPGNPQLIELKPRSREVVWTFEHFDLLGNDLTNTVVLD